MRIPITKPYFSEETFALVKKTIETGWVVQGPFVRELEEKFANYVGAKHAIAMNSCTSAQMVASRCIGLEPGDEVIVPAFTWISTANSVEFLGAKAVFVDINLGTFNIDVDRIEEKITDKTKAIYPVSLFGLPCNMPEIMEMAQRYDLKVVEDCACGLGGRIDSKHCGTLGDIGCFSFHPRKAITTGEGGMLITNNSEYARVARSLRDHGANRTDLDRHVGRGESLLPDYELLGYNFRMTDVQGAIGVAQMNILEEIMAKRSAMAARYGKLLEDVGFLTPPSVPDGYTTGWQAYVCLFEKEKINDIKQETDPSKRERMVEALGKERNRIMCNLEDKGISTRQGTHCAAIQDYYVKKYGIRLTDFLNSHIADRATLALPLYATMAEAEQDCVVEALAEAYKRGSE